MVRERRCGPPFLMSLALDGIINFKNKETGTGVCAFWRTHHQRHRGDDAVWSTHKGSLFLTNMVDMIEWSKGLQLQNRIVWPESYPSFVVRQRC